MYDCKAAMNVCMPQAMHAGTDLGKANYVPLLMNNLLLNNIYMSVILQSMLNLIGMIHMHLHDCSIAAQPDQLCSMHMHD